MKYFRYKKKEINLEESETDERDKIENPKKKLSNIQEPRGDENLEDTDNDTDTDL